MKTERIFEFRFSDSVSPLQHLAFLCKMLEAAEIAEKELAVEQTADFAEDSAA